MTLIKRLKAAWSAFKSGRDKKQTEHSMLLDLAMINEKDFFIISAEEIEPEWRKHFEKPQPPEVQND